MQRFRWPVRALTLSAVLAMSVVSALFALNWSWNAKNYREAAWHCGQWAISSARKAAESELAGDKTQAALWRRREKFYRTWNLRYEHAIRLAGVTHVPYPPPEPPR